MPIMISQILRSRLLLICFVKKKLILIYQKLLIL